jgi:RNA polymerase sigma-70 factor, ECF subfamily
MATLCSTFFEDAKLAAFARDEDALEAVLASLYETAREGEPSVDLPATTFVRALARRVPPGATSLDGLFDLRLSDLYLACACAEGNPRAIAEFERRYLANVPSSAEACRAVPPSDLITALREKLFVGANPKIAEYSGRGELASWLRVVALRTALNLARSSWREVALEEDTLVGARLASDDPEIQHLKTRYRQAFSEAFHAAFTGLTRRERTMLRCHYVDRMTMQQIADMQSVHRITVQRWMDRARSTLAAQTRRHLVAKLRLSEGELDSIMRLIGSQLDASLRSYARV